MNDNNNAVEIRGSKVLVVEDDFLVGESIRMNLHQLGCEVVGPVSTSEEACGLIACKDVEINAAILDIALNEGTSAPVAHKLKSMNLPFAFVTAYGDKQLLPDELLEYPRYDKPIDMSLLSFVLTRIMYPADGYTGRQVGPCGECGLYLPLHYPGTDQNGEKWACNFCGSIYNAVLEEGCSDELRNNVRRI